MRILALEHSRTAYRADFALYGAAVVALAAVLVVESPRALAAELVLLAGAGLAGWTIVEYALHRFVLHGMPPFRRWHAEHHERPAALICTPTVLSATLILVLVFLPALLLGSAWRASALTLGVLAGYLGYATTHHATHHWRADHPWLRQRKRWHAVHHHEVLHPVCFGVTTSFWDRVFGSAARPAAAARAAR